MRTYEHILAFCLEHPWALEPTMLRVIAATLGRRVAGGQATQDQIEDARGRRRESAVQRLGAVGVLPVYGVLAPRANALTNMSGGTSFDVLIKQLQDAVANAAIKSIVLDVDSPGGSVAGATEFAAEVRRAAAVKPVLAVAQYSMASAAYWVAAGATEIIAAPSARVGSIGVYTMHDDLSEALRMEGVSRTFIAAGKHKTLGNDSEPLSPDAREHLQDMVDAAYRQFVGDVAEGRGVPVQRVKTAFGEGLTLTAKDALAAGMVDKIATLEQTIVRAARSAPEPGRRVAGTAPLREKARQDRAAMDRALFELQLPDAHLTSRESPADRHQRRQLDRLTERVH